MANGPYTYTYPRPMVTVDAVVFSERDGARVVSLIERGHDPFAGSWALPGGFVDMDEPLEAAAARELEEETGLRGVLLEQFHTFGTPGRDPRGRNISVAYAGMVPWKDAIAQGGSDAARAAWFSLEELPPLAFDHREIVAYAVAWIQKEHPEW